MNKYFFCGIMCGAAFLCGCQTAKHSALNGKWELVTINGKSADKGNQTSYINIAISGKSIGGYDGCNNIGGEIVVGKQNEIKFGNLISTLRFCPEQGDNATLGKALESVKRYDITNSGDNIESLVLLDDKGNKVVSFIKQR